MFVNLFRITVTKLGNFKMKKGKNTEKVKRAASDAYKEIKKQLPCGAYKMISDRLNGKYTEGTIRQMFNGWRTMSPAVLQDAEEIIRFINTRVIDNDSELKTNQ